ncbi:hypothetical protein GCM10020255_024520 [Rhodococcus baikonurensis]
MERGPSDDSDLLFAELNRSRDAGVGESCCEQLFDCGVHRQYVRQCSEAGVEFSSGLPCGFCESQSSVIEVKGHDDTLQGRVPKQLHLGSRSEPAVLDVAPGPPPVRRKNVRHLLVPVQADADEHTFCMQTSRRDLHQYILVGCW